MSDLVLRYSESEHSLRSTGDPPGIVIFAYPGGHPALAIDYAYEPERYPEGVTTMTMHEEGISPTATVVAAEDLVKACIGGEELRHLYAFASQAVRDVVPIFLAAQNFDALRETVDFVHDLAAAIEWRLDSE